MNLSGNEHFLRLPALAWDILADNLLALAMFAINRCPLWHCPFCDEAAFRYLFCQRHSFGCPWHCLALLPGFLHEPLPSFPSWHYNALAYNFNAAFVKEQSNAW